MVLVFTAKDDVGIIMAKHNFFDVKAVQFHPKSILSEYGELLLKTGYRISNFIISSCVYV